MGQNIYSCPHCGSDNTIAMHVAYSNGHATGTFMRNQVVAYREDSEGHRTPVYANVQHQTNTTTDLARMVAPPQKPVLKQEEYNTVSMGCFSIGCLIPILGSLICGILGYFIYDPALRESIPTSLFWLMIILLVVFLISNRIKTKKKNQAAREQYARDMEKYNRDLEIWYHRYICMRCGHKFIVNE